MNNIDLIYIAHIDQLANLLTKLFIINKTKYFRKFMEFVS
jgi:hypothetical protein